MSIFNVSKLAFLMGKHPRWLLRWFKSGYAVMDKQDKEKLIEIIENNLEEIKKR